MWRVVLQALQKEEDERMAGLRAEQEAEFLIAQVRLSSPRPNTGPSNELICIGWVCGGRSARRVKKSVRSVHASGQRRRPKSKSCLHSSSQHATPSAIDACESHPLLMTDFESALMLLFRFGMW
jgi:hypothetical protein